MKISSNSQCPCGTLIKYKKCCKPFHDGSNPKTAEQLMRSRFSAFSLNKSDYIIETTHPDNQDYTLNLQSWEKDIRNFSDYTDFIKLEIYETIEGKEESFVNFRATLKQGKLDASFNENSRFLKVKGKWLYVDGIFTD
ncbi:YchJ family protein [Poseidonibacter antarcticus]|uniref:YchJ family protein n=1 Tax=Poseidonibacter antarcticus TaxID=2478538 RepID=UPI000EF493A9|nr:YchJ family metal-binding protein [Poseidonibacter antarcticus]